MKFKEFRCQPVWSKAVKLAIRDDIEEFGTFSPNENVSWLDSYDVLEARLDYESRVLFIKISMFCSMF